jgi:hypothetical protein
MGRYVEGSDRRQATLLPECLDDYIAEDNPVRVVEAFVEELDLEVLGFARAAPSATGRPAYHPSALLPAHLCGSSRRSTPCACAWTKNVDWRGPDPCHSSKVHGPTTALDASSPVSSFSSRSAASRGASDCSTWPPGNPQVPWPSRASRRPSRYWEPRRTTTPTPILRCEAR